MKAIKARRVVAVATMLAGALCLVGCSLTRHTELPKTNLQALEDDLRKAESQVEATSDSILDLQTGQEFEVRELFADYLATAELMDRSRDQLSRHLEQLRVQGLDYFVEWAKNNGGYVNPKIRLLTQEQVNNLTEQFLEISDDAEKTRRALAPFAFDVDQLRDMAPATPRKVDYLDFLIQKAQNDAESLTDAIDVVLGQIDTARTQLAQIAVPSPTAGRMRQSAPGGTSQPVPQETVPQETVPQPPAAPQPPAPQPPEPQPIAPESVAPEPTVPESATPEPSPLPELPPPPPEPQAEPGMRRMEQR